MQFHDYKRNAYAVTAAVLAFSLTDREPFICLMPLAIIIPLYLLCQDSLRNMLKIGAYIRVYYDEEGFSWERRNMMFSRMFMDEENKNKRKKSRIFYYESIFSFLILLCGILTIYKSFINQYSSAELAFRIVIIVCIVFVSLFIISSQEIHTTLTREQYKEIWEAVRSSEKESKGNVHSTNAC